MKSALLMATITTFIVSLTGCATMPQWQTVTKTTYMDSSQGYTVNLPTGWIKGSNKDGSLLTLSRNGQPLNLIAINRKDANKAFPAIKKQACITSATLPSDLAADFIAEAKIEQRIDNLQVLKNEPVTIDGKDGFHLSMQYLTNDGITYELETYGVCNSSNFYTIIYRAPKIYYFDQSLPAFNALVASFKFTSIA